MGARRNQPEPREGEPPTPGSGGTRTRHAGREIGSARASPAFLKDLAGYPLISGWLRERQGVSSERFSRPCSGEGSRPTHGHLLRGVVRPRRGRRPDMYPRARRPDRCPRAQRPDRCPRGQRRDRCPRARRPDRCPRGPRQAGAPAPPPDGCPRDDLENFSS